MSPLTPISTLPPPSRLTVITDEDCDLCRRCRAWLTLQPLLVEVEFLAVGSDEALRRFGPTGNRRDLLIVADEHGRIWSGPDAFVMCLWASDAYRGLARWAGVPGWRTLARAVFSSLSANRHRLAELMSGRCEDDRCDHHHRSIDDGQHRSIGEGHYRSIGDGNQPAMVWA